MPSFDARITSSGFVGWTSRAKLIVDGIVELTPPFTDSVLKLQVVPESVERIVPSPSTRLLPDGFCSPVAA